MRWLGVLLLAIASTNGGQSFAQKVSAVVMTERPSLTCPQTDLGDADLNARYLATWDRYSETIDVAGKKLQDEIEKQAKSATSAGNLDLTLFWKGLAKEFEQKGELRWDDATLKKTWSDRFGGSSYPSQFAVTLKKASEAFASSTKELEKGYGELVTELTKAEKLEEALKVRGELKELLAGSSPAPKPDPKIEPKPDQSTPKNGKYRFVFEDGTGNGFLLELADEILWIHGDIHPTKPNGISVWPNPRAVPCRIVNGKVLTDDGDPATNKWRCAITWDTKSGEAGYLYDNFKGNRYQKRGRITAGAW